ncbi:MAG: PAS domain S-box protein [Actinobacteria bacterium]|nr:PAS domain S-box protein [Actinomycetota bacterium]
MNKPEPLNILVVDDEPDTADMLSLVLKRSCSAQTQKSLDCKSAIEKLRNTHFDLVTLDFQLPDCDGLSLLKEINAMEEPPSVVMVTGHGDENTAAEAFRLGAAGYVVKDTRISVMLVEEVKSALSRIELERTEKALAESEETLRELYKLSNQGISITDRNRRIVFANQQAANILGFKNPEDIVGMLSDDFYPNEEERDKLYKILYQTGAVEDYELRFKGKNPDPVWVSLSISTRYDKKGDILNTITFFSDITGRKKAAEELLSSEQRLKNAQEIGKIGSWEYDLANKEITWSEETYRLYERDPSSGPPTLEEEAAYYPPEQAKLLREHADRAVREHRGFKYDIELNLPSGRRAYYATTIQPVKDNEGRIVKLFGTIQDVTDWKKAEEALRIQHDLAVDLLTAVDLNGAFEKILDSVLRIESVDSGGIYVMDPETGAIDLAVHRGLSDEFISAVSHYDPDSARSLVEILKTGEIRYGMYEDTVADIDDTRKKEGLKATAIVPVLYEGSFIASLTLASHTKEEVSEGDRQLIELLAFQTGSLLSRRQAADSLVESENRYRRMFEGAIEGIALTTIDGEVIDVNSSLAQIFGFDSPEQMKEEITNAASQIYADPAEREEVKRLLLENGAIREKEIRVKRRDGSTFWALVSIRIVKDRGGKFLYLESSCIDITERKTAEENLKRINEELQAYAHTISHGLKGPLASIGIASDLIRADLNEADSGGIKELIDTIIKNNSTAIERVDRLLKLAESGQAPTAVSDVKIGEVIFSILDEVCGPVSGRTVRTIVDHEMGSLKADRMHIEQIFINLITNAVKHNENPDPEIRISCIGGIEDGSVRYLVRDNGHGIPKDDLERVFIPFHKSGKSSETGLGLPIALKIARVYGGGIRAYNDNGACFEVTLKDYDID